MEGGTWSQEQWLKEVVADARIITRLKSYPVGTNTNLNGLSAERIVFSNTKPRAEASGGELSFDDFR